MKEYNDVLHGLIESTSESSSGSTHEVAVQNQYRFVTSTEVTKLVIHRGAVGPEENNQLSYRIINL